MRNAATVSLALAIPASTNEYFFIGRIGDLDSGSMGRINPMKRELLSVSGFELLFANIYLLLSQWLMDRCLLG